MIGRKKNPQCYAIIVGGLLGKQKLVRFGWQRNAAYVPAACLLIRETAEWSHLPPDINWTALWFPDRCTTPLHRSAAHSCSLMSTWLFPSRLPAAAVCFPLFAGFFPTVDGYDDGVVVLVVFFLSVCQWFLARRQKWQRWRLASSASPFVPVIHSVCVCVCHSVCVFEVCEPDLSTLGFFFLFHFFQPGVFKLSSEGSLIILRIH